MEFVSSTDESITLEDFEKLLISVSGPINGADTEGAEFNSLQCLWDKELQQKSSKATTTPTVNSEWYSNAYEFWEDPSKCPITDDGVLQGFGCLTESDTKGSNEFLDKLMQKNPELVLEKAADCGAGIGRVTKHFLLPRFQHVDMIEQSPRLSKSSADYIGVAASQRTTCIVAGLQDFEPSPASYDIIWIQWVIGHVADLDCIKFFRRCAKGLKRNGYICLKGKNMAYCSLLASLSIAVIVLILT